MQKQMTESSHQMTQAQTRNSIDDAPNLVFASTGMTSEQKAHELERIVTGLIAILDQENDLIIQRPLGNLNLFKEMGQKKQRLFDEYHALMSALGSIKSFTSALAANMRAHLKSLCTRYEETADMNQRRMKIALETSSAILHAVADIQHSTARVVSYDAQGVLKKPESHLPLGIRQEV